MGSVGTPSAPPATTPVTARGAAAAGASATPTQHRHALASAAGSDTAPQHVWATAETAAQQQQLDDPGARQRDQLHRIASREGSFTAAAAPHRERASLGPPVPSDEPRLGAASSPARQSSGLARRGAPGQLLVDDEDDVQSNAGSAVSLSSASVLAKRKSLGARISSKLAKLFRSSASVGGGGERGGGADKPGGAAAGASASAAAGDA